MRNNTTYQNAQAAITDGNLTSLQAALDQTKTISETVTEYEKIPNPGGSYELGTAYEIDVPREVVREKAIPALNAREKFDLLNRAISNEKWGCVNLLLQHNELTLSNIQKIQDILQKKIAESVHPEVSALLENLTLHAKLLTVRDQLYQYSDPDYRSDKEHRIVLPLLASIDGDLKALYAGTVKQSDVVQQLENALIRNGRIEEEKHSWRFSFSRTAQERKHDGRLGKILGAALDQVDTKESKYIQAVTKAIAAYDKTNQNSFFRNASSGSKNLVVAVKEILGDGGLDTVTKASKIAEAINNGKPGKTLHDIFEKGITMKM